MRNLFYSRRRVFNWKRRKRKLHILWKIHFQHHFFLVYFPASSSQEPPAGSDIFALCSNVHGEGHAAQVAVSGRIVNDALPIQFALYLDVSVIVHSCKTHSHHRWGVVDLRLKHDRRYFRLIRHSVCVCMSQLLLKMTHTHMSELPIVWIVVQVKCALRKKLDFSQSIWRSFLKDEEEVMFLWPAIVSLTPLWQLFYWHIAAIKGHVGKKSVDSYCTLTSQVTFIGLPWPGK